MASAQKGLRDRRRILGDRLVPGPNARGIAFDCFEKGSEVGGNWRYMNDNGMSSAYRSLHINTSRGLMAYGTYPMPEDYPDYPNHFQIAALLRRLRRPLRLPRQDPLPHRGIARRAGRRRVGGHGRGRGRQGRDAPLPRRDRRQRPSLGSALARTAFPGAEEFEGEQIHVHDYREPEMLRGKRVLVLGIGNSATDIAVEGSRIAEKPSWRCAAARTSCPSTYGKPTDERRRRC